MSRPNSLSCPSWSELVAARDLEADRETPTLAGAAAPERTAWEEALAHLDECPDCRREAFAADPTLVFRRLPEPRVTKMDVDAIRRGVAALREASRLGETARPAEGAAETAAPPVFAALFDRLDAADAASEGAEEAAAGPAPLPFRPAVERRPAAETAAETLPAETAEKRVAAGGGGRWRAWAPRVAAAGLMAVGLSLAPAALEHGTLSYGPRTAGERTAGESARPAAAEAVIPDLHLAALPGNGFAGPSRAGTGGALGNGFADDFLYAPAADEAAAGGSPLIENLDLPDPRVYQLAEEGVQVVMVIDSSLADLDLEPKGIDS